MTENRVRDVFWLPDRPNRRAFPSDADGGSLAILRRSSPDTAAGPPRIGTVFRFIEPNEWPIIANLRARLSIAPFRKGGRKPA